MAALGFKLTRMYGGKEEVLDIETKIRRRTLTSIGKNEEIHFRPYNNCKKCSKQIKLGEELCEPCRQAKTDKLVAKVHDTLTKGWFACHAPPAETEAERSERRNFVAEEQQRRRREEAVGECLYQACIEADRFITRLEKFSMNAASDSTELAGITSRAPFLRRTPSVSRA